MLKNIGANGIHFVGSANSNIEGNMVDGFGASGASATGLPAGILITNVPGYDSPSFNNAIKYNEANNRKGYGIMIGDSSGNNE